MSALLFQLIEVALGFWAAFAQTLLLKYWWFKDMQYLRGGAFMNLISLHVVLFLALCSIRILFYVVEALDTEVITNEIVGTFEGIVFGLCLSVRGGIAFSFFVLCRQFGRKDGSVVLTTLFAAVIIPAAIFAPVASHILMNKQNMLYVTWVLSWPAYVTIVTFHQLGLCTPDPDWRHGSGQASTKKFYTIFKRLCWTGHLHQLCISLACIVQLLTADRFPANEMNDFAQSIYQGSNFVILLDCLSVSSSSLGCGGCITSINLGMVGGSPESASTSSANAGFISSDSSLGSDKNRLVSVRSTSTHLPTHL